MQWIFGFQISQAIYVAAELGIADLLEQGPLHYGELSGRVDCHPDSLYRLLKALASIGIFSEGEAGVYENSELSGLLISGREHSLHSTATMYGDEHYRVWADLLSSVKTGDSCFSRIYGTDYFSYLERQSSSLKKFSQYMNKDVDERIDAILAAYDFSGTRHLVDVGGGYGLVVMALLKKYDGMRGTVFDIEKVILQAQDRSETSEYRDRITFAAGSFIDTVPGNADTYLLSQILHGLNDSQAAAVLRHCRRGISADGRLLIVERLLLPGNAMDYGKWMDLNMLLMLEGKERTQDGYARLLEAQGFELVRVRPTTGGLSMLECRPVALDGAESGVPLTGTSHAWTPGHAA